MRLDRRDTSSVSGAGVRSEPAGETSVNPNRSDV
jgi:hypothetical protein